MINNSLQTCIQDESYEDIGSTSIGSNGITRDIESYEQRVLRNFFHWIGNFKVTLSKLEEIPLRIIEKALQAEHGIILTDAYKEVQGVTITRK